MYEFFRGWRRKAGCAALLIALVLIIGWIRSLVVMDVLLVPSGAHTMEHCVSVDHSFIWGRVRRANANSVIRYPVYSANPSCNLDSFLDLANLKCDWRWFGFAAGQLNVASADRFNHTMWIIPYWSLTIPLSLLSVYLIFWKPQQSHSRSAHD